MSAHLSHAQVRVPGLAAMTLGHLQALLWELPSDPVAAPAAFLSDRAPSPQTRSGE